MGGGMVFNELMIWMDGWNGWDGTGRNGKELDYRYRIPCLWTLFLTTIITTTKPGSL